MATESNSSGTTKSTALDNSEYSVDLGEKKRGGNAYANNGWNSVNAEENVAPKDTWDLRCIVARVMQQSPR